MKRTFVYKLRPTRVQAQALETTLETCRRLYNDALAERKAAWEARGHSISFAAQSASLPQRKAQTPHLAAVHVASAAKRAAAPGSRL